MCTLYFSMPTYVLLVMVLCNSSSREQNIFGDKVLIANLHILLFQELKIRPLLKVFINY